MVESQTVCLRRLANGRPGDEKRFGRFLANEAVTVERLVAGWCVGTGAAAAGRHVLAIQDTTEVCFPTDADHDRDLGPIGRGTGRGLLIHPVLALDAETGTCLGLAGGSLWSRPPRRAGTAPSSGRAVGPPVPSSSLSSSVSTPVSGARRNNARRPQVEKETRCWLDGASDAKAVLGEAASVTLIADREADFYGLWAGVPDGERVHVLGRVFHDRTLGAGGKLFQTAAGWPVLGRRSIEIRERQDRPGRSADLEVRAGRVTLRRPAASQDTHLPPTVDLTFLEVRETTGGPNAPSHPLLWRLLTSHRVESEADAWRIVDFYRRRWTIEQFFRLLKTRGLRLEDSQLESAERLLKLSAVATRAAVRVLQLLQARDGPGLHDAALVFCEAELITLEAIDRKDYTTTNPARNNPHPKRSMPWATWIIARMGGWNGYTSPKASKPGPITIRNGLERLQAIAIGWDLSESTKIDVSLD